MPSSKDQKRDLIRMALLIQQRLAEAQELKPLQHIPESDWQECQRLARLAEKAIKRRWFGAAWGIRPRLTRALGALKDALDGTLTEYLQQAPPPCPSLKELHAELLGLVDEFPGAELDLGDKTIAVATESIVLEDVDLGAFKIELDLTSDGKELTYTVIATDPNPAAKSEKVTHPHVQSDHLCEGDGRLPLCDLRDPTSLDPLLPDRRLSEHPEARLPMREKEARKKAERKRSRRAQIRRALARADAEAQADAAQGF